MSDSMSDIMKLAIEKNVDSERLRLLIESQERADAKSRSDKYAAAMLLVQAEMPTVLRDSENKQTRSYYAKLEDIQKVAKPIYVHHGFTLSFTEVDAKLPNHKALVCDISHAGGHVEQKRLELPIDGIGPKGAPMAMNPVQSEVSTTTYIERRLIAMIFNITIADEDDDGQATSYVTREQTETLVSLVNKWNPTDAEWNGFVKWSGVPDRKEMWRLDRQKFPRAAEIMNQRIAANAASDCRSNP